MDAPSPQAVLDFYADLLDNSKNYLKYHLSNDVTLDWFGQTVKGQSNVANFIKLKVKPIRHYLDDAVKMEKIGFRDTHRVCLENSRPATRSRMALLSPPRPTLMATPKKRTAQQQPSTSRKRAVSQPKFDEKRLKVAKSTEVSCCQNNNDVDVLESENDVVNERVQYLSCAGDVEFHRRSLKKLQAETKWRRPCKLHLAYDVTNNDVKDLTFYLIIYEGNVKCKRNLLSAFEEEEF